MSDYTTNRNVNDLKPLAQKALALFLEEAKKQNLNVLVTETLRTQERQNYLACQGRTIEQAVSLGVPRTFATQHANPKGLRVTWTLTGNHAKGMAWDICKNVKGQEYSDTSFFKKCGEIAKGLNIEWGGTWSTPDMPHMQIGENWTPPKQTPPPKDDKAHWAYTDWEYLNKNGVPISDLRFNEAPTRGEVIALLARVHKALQK